MTIVASLGGEVITRLRVLVGEDGDPSRRGARRVVAKSECSFVCTDFGSLSRCVEQLRLSDEHLRNRPEEMMLWEWQNTYVDDINEQTGGGTVVLGVAWYNEDFFIDHKDAYTNPLHLSKYIAIGIPVGCITVTHWKCVGEGTL
jgi:hypothetical protein